LFNWSPGLHIVLDLLYSPLLTFFLEDSNSFFKLFGKFVCFGVFEKLCNNSLINSKGVHTPGCKLCHLLHFIDAGHKQPHVTFHSSYYSLHKDCSMSVYVFFQIKQNRKKALLLYQSQTGSEFLSENVVVGMLWNTSKLLLELNVQ